MALMAWKPDYLSTPEVKAYPSTPLNSTASDVQIAVNITAASRAIDDHCHRQFGKVDAPEERFYTAVARTDRGRWVVDIDDLMTTTGLVVEVDGDALTGYTLEPRNAAADGMPWTRLVVDEDSAVMPSGAEYEIAITATWGWTAVPTSIKQATYLQVNRLLKRRDAPFGVTGSPEGPEIRLLDRVDPDVAVVLRPFVRTRLAS